MRGGTWNEFYDRCPTFSRKMWRPPDVTTPSGFGLAAIKFRLPNSVLHRIRRLSAVLVLTPSDFLPDLR